MCHNPLLGKTLNVVCTVSGSHSRLLAQISINVATDLLAIQSFQDDGLSGCSLWPIC